MRIPRAEYLAELKFEDESLLDDWEAHAKPWLQQVMPHLGATDMRAE